MTQDNDKLNKLNKLSVNKITLSNLVNRIRKGYNTKILKDTYLWKNSDSDKRYITLNKENNYKLNLGNYLYNIASYNNDEKQINISLKNNIFGIRFDKLFSHVSDESIDTVNEYLNYLNKTNDEKKIIKDLP